MQHIGIRGVYANLIVYKGVENRSKYHLTEINFKVSMNTIRYILEVKVDPSEIHNPRSILVTGIKQNITQNKLLSK